MTQENLKPIKDLLSNGVCAVHEDKKQRKQKTHFISSDELKI